MTDTWWHDSETGKAYLGDRECDETLKHLADRALAEPSPANQADLALAYFHCEDYEKAARHYRAALEEEQNSGWEHMLALAEANAVAEASVPVPDAHYFQAKDLLAPPTIAEGAIPATPAPVPQQDLGKRLLRGLGNVVGSVATFLFEGIAAAVGKLFGYRDAVWTNWYRRQLSLGVITLGYMREQLNKHNLKSTYPKGALVGFQEPGQSPPPGVRHFRTSDGTWNNLDDPMEGAAGTRFPRNVEDTAIRPESGERLMTPNPREVSRRLLAARGGERQVVPFLNMLAAQWIQFQNHDWITHGDNLVGGAHAVALAEDDPARERFRQTHMYIGRTQPDPTRRSDDTTPITFINEVTHWWDGSQLYGSDQETQDRLRSHVDGKMRLHDDGTLPLGPKGVEDSGMVRNWWVGLSMMHLLFVKEHNAICDRLKEAHPDWDDTRLFNVARLVNAAVMAKIHSIEWTPGILPNLGLDLGLNANWYGLLTNLLRKEKNRKTKATFNVRNPELGGVVGNPVNKHGSPFGLSEEFVEVYRLHPLLPEELEIRQMTGNGEVVERIPFAATRQAGSRKVTARLPITDLWASMGVQQPGQLVLHNYPAFLQELSVPGNPLFDMGTVDILRARERGVPRYNEFRRQLGLNPIRTFADLTDDGEIVAELEAVYGTGPEAVEDLDLLVGTLAEEHRPTGFGFGETLFQIFILNATRRLQADRFYTDSYDEQTYSKEGLEWIDQATLKRVLLRHYPELEQTGLGNVKNAFEPWDTDQHLDGARHPLRARDKELRPDPFLGDAYR